MINRKFFFESIRLSLFAGQLSSSQVNGMTAILEWTIRLGGKHENGRVVFRDEAEHIDEPVPQKGGKESCGCRTLGWRGPGIPGISGPLPGSLGVA